MLKYIVDVQHELVNRNAFFGHLLVAPGTPEGDRWANPVANYVCSLPTFFFFFFLRPLLYQEVRCAGPLGVEISCVVYKVCVVNIAKDTGRERCLVFVL